MLEENIKLNMKNKGEIAELLQKQIYADASKMLERFLESSPRTPERLESMSEILHSALVGISSIDYILNDSGLGVDLANDLQKAGKGIAKLQVTLACLKQSVENNSKQETKK